MYKKLKSENLMIGNYLLKDEIIHRVVAIVDNSESKKSDTIRTNKSSDYIFIDRFEPILITKDILKKLGFERNGNIFTHPDFQRYSLHQGILVWSICVCEDSPNFHNYPTELLKTSDLHSLQNLFSSVSDKKLIFGKSKQTSKTKTNGA